MNVRVVSSLLLLIAAFAATAATPPARPVAFTNATVVDPAGGSHRPGMTVLVEGERITAVFPTGKRPLPEGARSVDLAGRFVIPGLIDSHTHMTPVFAESQEALDRELARLLDGGVVATRDMAGNANVILAAVDSIRRGEKRGPDIFHSVVMGGPQFAASDWRMARSAGRFKPGEAPWSQAVAPGMDVQKAVRRAAETKATALKLYMQIDRDLFRELAAEAHRQGLRVWSHATVYPTRPIDVVRGGSDVISHLCGLAWQDADLDPAAFANPHIDNRPSFDPRLVDADGPEMTALFREMVRRGTILDATLSNHLRPADDRHGCTSELVVSLARAAHRAGVVMVAGTDYVTPASDPYPALHREIEALVDEGILTNSEALAAATVNGARALGRERDYGTIEPGKLASFVVLAADPLDNIRALRTVVSVVKRGEVFPRQAATAMTSAGGAATTAQ